MSFEYLTLDEQVRREAEQRGINKGIKQGRKEDKLEQAQETYDRMVEDGFTPEQARKYAYGS